MRISRETQRGRITALALPTVLYSLALSALGVLQVRPHAPAPCQWVPHGGVGPSPPTGTQGHRPVPGISFTVPGKLVGVGLRACWWGVARVVGRVGVGYLPDASRIPGDDAPEGGPVCSAGGGLGAVGSRGQGPAGVTGCRGSPHGLRSSPREKVLWEKVQPPPPTQGHLQQESIHRN